MTKHTIFITGTDTNIGKTYVSVRLLHYFKQQGLETIGLKPIASGCTNGTNDDALQLSRAATQLLPYEQVNPFALDKPIAPHLAAKSMGLDLSITQLNKKMAAALSIPTDICLIEGAGGWLVPLNEKETYADYVLSNDMAIILVVGMRLGCINHALLTCQSIIQQKGRLMGWIANSGPHMMDQFYENITTLMQWMPVPYLGKVMPDDELNFSPTIHRLMKKKGPIHLTDVIINDLVN